MDSRTASNSPSIPDSPTRTLSRESETSTLTAAVPSRTSSGPGAGGERSRGERIRSPRTGVETTGSGATARREGEMEAPRARAEGTGGAATTQAFEYPVQRHAGSLGPNYKVGGGFGDKVHGMRDIIKGKLTNNAELIENGRMRQTGELRERERAREKQEEADPFSKTAAAEKMHARAGTASKGKGPDSPSTKQ